jgi:hypothetical protein
MHEQHPETSATTMYVPPIIFDRNSLEVPTLVRVADLLWCGAGLSGLYDTSTIMPPTSVYSLPLSLADRIGGWDGDDEAIGEDLHMYLKCFLRLNGDLTTRVVLSAASQTNVSSEKTGFAGLVDGHNARYKQAIRHMWGALDTGYTVRHMKSLMTRPQSTNVLEHSVRIIALAHRLFEAHFLPMHLMLLAFSSAIYTIIVPREQVPEVFIFAFAMTGYLRLLGFICMATYFHLYESYHSTCVHSRADEMQRAGLYEKMSVNFAYREGRGTWIDKFIFPVAGTLFGTIPGISAEIQHFWTTKLVYSVSVKPTSGKIREAVVEKQG